MAVGFTPCEIGGICIRRAVQLAPSAYLASAAGCSKLTNFLLPSSASINPDPHIQIIWSQGHNHTPPSAPESHHQKCWDGPPLTMAFWNLPPTNVQRPASDLWLIQNRGLANCSPYIIFGVCVMKMGRQSVSTSQVYQLWIELLWTNWVPMGCHVVSVKGDMPGTQQSIKWSLDSAKIPSHLEHVGLYRSDGKRLDGVTLVSCKEGRVHVLKSVRVHLAAGSVVVCCGHWNVVYFAYETYG